ncbi:hypothetical protein ACYCUO_17255 [Paenibacillus sp. SEL2]
MLYEVAFGVYDWTQYKAMRVLTRLAREGLQTDQIVDDIISHVNDFRYEVQMPTFYFLSGLTGHKKVASLLQGSRNLNFALFTMKTYTYR